MITSSFRLMVASSQLSRILPVALVVLIMTTANPLLAQRDILIPRQAAFVQDPFGGPPRVVPVQGEEARNADEDADEGPPIPIDRTVAVIKPNEIRLHMMDGSILTGELETNELAIRTDFGELIVPIERIRRLRPGLRSYPELRQRIDTLIEELGVEDFNTREAAHKSLIGYGLQIRNLIDDAPDSDNAERKRHLQEIRKAIEELAQEESDLEEDRVEAWINEDQIVTDSFTILGDLAVENFAVRSRFGPLSVQLADIREGDRMYGIKEAVSRSITVSGEYLAALKFKSSRVRLEKGDQITVRASGNLVMTPWGSNSFTTPNGATNYGMYNQFPGGALIAKIGESGDEFLIGERKTFTATRSGVLHFAVAVQRDYVGSGYTYPGQYSVRLKVEPN